MKLGRDLPGKRSLPHITARPNWSRHRVRLLAGKHVTPPIGIGGRHSSVAAKALSGRDPAFYWPSNYAAQQLWVRPAMLPLSSPRFVSSTSCPVVARSLLRLCTRHRGRPWWAMGGIQARRGLLIVGRVPIVVRPPTVLRALTRNWPEGSGVR